MNKIWIYGIVLLSLVTVVSAIVVQSTTVTRLDAKLKSDGVSISGELFSNNKQEIGIINIFCEHLNNIEFLGSTDYYLSNSARGYTTTFFFKSGLTECIRGDSLWVEIGNYKSNIVNITTRHHHKHKVVIKTPELTLEEECELDNTKEWVENQCVDKEIPLTPKEECELDSDMEWVNDECVLKEVPVCYDEVCEQVQTTCNTWNYREECDNVWGWNWFKNHSNKLCTSHNHQNCNFRYGYTEVCEDVKTTCNTWNYEEQCEQVEVSCTN